ncbi:MAG: hypothetical protein JWQ90_5556 [Hydrocarboniphaga sp.]|uniref:hypothetical protein n=1 Tax=Hydrocarboniphaga sp. TaxID=2033016 RepID=UPI00261EA2AC|nr:hypothetical protein [Hydrocarboniphaga sp.]MDB5973106.1 hypothetical protein [Hydrocarboniphaga sp.]
MGEETNKTANAGLLARTQTFVAFTSAVVGVLAAVQALSSKGDADRSAREASAFKEDIERQANSRAERESKAKFDTVAYEAAVKVLELDRAKISPDLAEKRERAALALIASTASEPMQAALFDVIGSGQSVTPSVKREAGQAADILRDIGSLASEAPNQAVPTPPSSTASAVPQVAAAALTGYRVVLFYCQNPANVEVTNFQRSAAEKLAAELKADRSLSSLKIAWETKELPEVLNSVSGYGIRNNQIRFNPADNEETPSLALKVILESNPSVQSYKASFERRIVNQRTPYYLSVFLCGLNPSA